MTIQNYWKIAIQSRGVTQAGIAALLAVNKPHFSRVVSGDSVLSPTEFERACALLTAEPQELYPQDVLSAIYGIREDENAPTVVSIKLRGDAARLFDRVKRLNRCENNAEMVSVLMKKYLKGQVGNDCI